MTTKNAAKPTIQDRIDALTLIETAIALLMIPGNSFASRTDTQVSTLTRVAAAMVGLKHDDVWEAVMQKAHHDRNYEMHQFKRSIARRTASEVVDISKWDEVRAALRCGGLNI